MVHSPSHFAWFLFATCRMMLGLMLLDTSLSARSYAEADGSRGVMLRAISLKDVHPLHGGQHFYLRGDGTGFCQVIAWNAITSGLWERRFSLRASPDSVKSLNTLITPDSLAALAPKDRPGVPDEARSTLSATWATGRSLRISKWANDAYPAFDQIYSALLIECQSAQKTKPIYEGAYDPTWVPDGF